MFDTKNMSGETALLEAQKIAFGPIVFQVARLLRDWGIFELLHKKRKTPLSAQEIADAVEISLYAAKVLCESGFSMGALSFENEKYSLTKIGYILQNDGMTIANLNCNHDVNYLGLFYLDKALRDGEPTGLHKVFDTKEETTTLFLQNFHKKLKIAGLDLITSTLMQHLKLL